MPWRMDGAGSPALLHLRRLRRPRRPPHHPTRHPPRSGHPAAHPARPTTHKFRSCAQAEASSSMAFTKWIPFAVQSPNNTPIPPPPEVAPVVSCADGKQFGLENVCLPSPLGLCMLKAIASLVTLGMHLWTLLFFTGCAVPLLRCLPPSRRRIDMERHATTIALPTICASSP